MWYKLTSIKEKWKKNMKYMWHWIWKERGGSKTEKKWKSLRFEFDSEKKNANNVFKLIKLRESARRIERKSNKCFWSRSWSAKRLIIRVVITFLTRRNEAVRIIGIRNVGEAGIIALIKWRITFVITVIEWALLKYDLKNRKFKAIDLNSRRIKI